MKKIIFICHGNICRSPVGEILFNKLVKEKGLDKKYFAISRATSFEEINNDIYPPMKKILIEHNIEFNRHHATRITKEDFLLSSYIFYMDYNNYYNLTRMFGDDKKMKLISIFYNNKEIEDPWYTNRFEYVYNEIYQCVKNIISYLEKEEEKN